MFISAPSKDSNVKAACVARSAGLGPAAAALLAAAILVRED